MQLLGFLGGQGHHPLPGANVMVRDLDLLPHDRVDNRRLEVVADDLHGGSAAGHRHHHR